mgnify:CR=1 FL=1
MDFTEMLKRVDRELYDATDKSVLPKIARFMERSDGLVGLLKTQNAVLDALAVTSIPRLSDVYAHYVRWKDAYRNTKRVLAESRLTVPDNSLARCAFPHELSAIERAARMCPRAGYPDVDSWQQSVDAHLDLWNACVAVAEKEGTVTCTMVKPDHPDASLFDAYTFTRERITELKNYTWLGARRGHRAGVLDIRFELPLTEIHQQASVYIPNMGIAARQRNADSVVEELVGNNLESALLARLDYRSFEEAIATARNAYFGLLSTPPLKAGHIVGVYFHGSKDRTGLVCTDGNGALQDKTDCAPDTDPGDVLDRLIASCGAEAVVIPATAADSDRLRQLEERLADRDLTVSRILPSAMDTAKQAHDLPPSVAGALVLVHRAIRPATEWANVPAERLGIGEFSSELPAEKLAEALAETKLLVRYQVKRGGPGAIRTASVQKKRRLNPLVKTIRDLKPGMTLDGVVTNLTKFGAFVNVGLTTEAMIHVSQLSTEFIDEPSQVVSIGQTVNARVLEVIPEKGRIALSLKPAGMDHVRTAPESRELREAREQAASIFSDLGPRHDDPLAMGGSPAMPEQAKVSRSKALADLDALFKK